MKKYNKLLTVFAAILAAATLGGCASQGKEEAVPPVEEREQAQTATPEIPEMSELPEIPETVIPEAPVQKVATYLRVTGEGVNIRSGAGTGYSSLGTAEKDTLYACLGKSGSWYITKFKDKTAYISEKYCALYEMDESDESIESVIQSGLRFMGVKYVYGAVRYHDGKGNKLKNFTTEAFDCSSLMQYIFFDGAGVLLDVNTRTQVYQGRTVSKSNLKRGDLLFFTNASRRNLSGVERIGHVALYLGDNYILHTASDYAKIEQITSSRWSNYIQAQRIL